MSWSHAACNNSDKQFLTTVFALVHILDAVSRTFVSLSHLAGTGNCMYNASPYNEC